MENLKYVETKLVFSEIPDELSMAISISNCPCNCKGCHSSYLADDIGHVITTDFLKHLIENNKGITCLLFMGGDSNPKLINKFASYIKKNFSIKVAWYSGRDTIDSNIDLNNFDYIKIGSYKEEYGPLNNRNTNQKLFKVIDNNLLDFTYKFWK